MNVISRLAAVAFVAVLLTACATKGESMKSAPPTPPGASSGGTQSQQGGQQQQQAEGGGAETSAVPGQQGFQGSPLDNPDSQLYQKIVYFDFDTSTIKDEYKPLLKAHAQYLMDHPEARVTLEGNTDERGSREYNMALGERRAKAVYQYLTLLGVSPSQLQTVSFGEERPAALGHDEKAWAKNRRVVLDYTKR